VGVLAAVIGVTIYGLNFYREQEEIISVNAERANAGAKHVLVTGGAGYIGSHATLKLLEDGHSVTIVDNLSRGNMGAVEVLRALAPRKRLRFVKADLGVRDQVEKVFAQSNFDYVIHFAAIAFVGESTKLPLMYYSNITVNTVILLEAMKKHQVNNLIYSSTCATYGNPDVLPITEETPAIPINPYGKAKLAAEVAVRDYANSNPDFKAVIFRYFNVYGADIQGRLGEYPPPALVGEGRISTACFAAALGVIPRLTIMGTQHPTPDGSCVRDYIHVADLVDAHITGTKAFANPPALFNIGTGVGISVKEFTNACLKVTGKEIEVFEQAEARPGDYAAVYADPSKINRELNWTAKYTDVEEALGHAWAWRSKHPYGY